LQRWRLQRLRWRTAKVVRNPPTDIYIIGVDSLGTLTRGTYAGLPNPNHRRLTFLYTHYTPGTEHFHSIGAWSYTGSRDTPIVRDTSGNNRIPELG
jgi:hypothetical protein